MGTANRVVAAWVALLALAAGCGDDGDQGYASPGTDKLTDRQTEMLDIAEDYAAGWTAKDGNAVALFMTDAGVVVYPEEGWTFSVTDGSLQDRVTNGPYSTSRTLDPMLIYGDRIVLTGRIDALDLAWLSILKFTRTGEVKIISETLYL